MQSLKKSRVYILLFLLLTSGPLSALEAYRSAILHFLADPMNDSTTKSFEYFKDGILVVDDGKVVAVGEAEDLLPTIPETIPVHVYEDTLITPGFIDAHIHFPQFGIIASYGEQLLEWLEKYTFPYEKRFLDKDYADRIADKFIAELLRNGTTSTLAFAGSSKESLEALFEAAQSRNMRIIAGNFLSDRNLPDRLLQPLETAYLEAKELIKQWHQKGRLQYAATPRFAPTSTEAQLTMVKQLLNEHPDIYLHTHLSENIDEVEWVKNLFPWSKDYLDVYDHFGFLRPRSIFAHSIHLSDSEIKRLSKSKSTVSFCPTSNLFLGSGLFKWKKCRDAQVLIGLGTDVGAGTSFSMLQTMGEGYKVAQLQGNKITPLEAFYHVTLGGAKALDIDKYIGNFETGKEADFVILDLKATPLMEFRMNGSKELAEQLFLLMILGDDRNILETYIMGKCQHSRDNSYTHRE